MPRWNVRDDTGRFTTAKIRLVMEGGRKVREELVVTGKFFSEHLGTKVAGTAVHKTELGIRTLIGSLFQLRTIIATVGKALISGFAITAVFGALFAAVNALKSLFIDVADFALKTVSQLKEMQLGLQALLATTGEFSADIKKNFELAGKSARQLRAELIKLDPRTLGGLKELQVATQALLATGAQGMVSTTDGARELAATASLLVNTVVLLTGRVNDQRQIFSEIKELMLGNVRAQNQVAQLIASQVGDLDAWLAKMRTSRDLLEGMQSVLGGINEAADEFLNTLTSVEASEIAINSLIAERAYGTRVDSLIQRKRELLEYTEDNVDAIARFKSHMAGWAFIWQEVVLLAGQLWTRIQAISGWTGLMSDTVLARLKTEVELLKALFTGETLELPTTQGGGGDSLGLTRSMEVLDSIRDGVKGLDSDIKNVHIKATKSAGDLMDDYSRGLFKLNNMLAEANKGILKPLRDAAEEMRSLRDATGQFALTVRLEAAKEVVRLANKIIAVEDSLKKLEENTLAALRKKHEEARLKSANRIAAALSALNAIQIAGLNKTLTIEQQVENARQGTLRTMERHLSVLKELGYAAKLRVEIEKKTVTRINEQAVALEKYLKLESAKRVAEAETSLSRIDVAGLSKFLSIEEKVAKAVGDALEAMRKQLLVLEEENVLLGVRLQWEDKITAHIYRRGKALRDHLELKRQERIDAAMVGIESIQIAGLNRVLSIEQQVENARQGGLRTLERFIDSLRKQGVLAREWLLIQLEGKAAIESQSVALKKQRDLQESLAAGRHLLERFSLQRQGVILPGDQPTGFKQLLEERQRRTQQLAGLRSGLKAGDGTSPGDIREAETLVASLDSELRNLLSTANSVASVIGGAMTKAVLTLLEKGGNIMDFLRNLRANLKAVGEQMIFAFGQAFANAIQGLILGTSSIKEAIGGLIIAIGNLAIAMGTVLILGSLFLGFGSIPIGLALIAAGAGMIALGALLGGSGPSGGALGAQPNATNQTPTFSFNQAQVDVQQGHARSNADLVQATSRLAEAHKSLDALPPGVVVKKGNAENGGLLTSVSRESGQGRQFVAQTNLARNLAAV